MKSVLRLFTNSSHHGLIRALFHELIKVWAAACYFLNGKKCTSNSVPSSRSTPECGLFANFPRLGLIHELINELIRVTIRAATKVWAAACYFLSSKKSTSNSVPTCTPECGLCWNGCEGDAKVFRTGCNCKGSTGHAHVKCVAKHAAAQDEYAGGDFSDRWLSCSVCHGNFTGEFQREMLLEKVKFEEPGRPNYWLVHRAVALHWTATSLRNNQRIHDAIDLIEQKKKMYGSKEIELRQSCALSYNSFMMLCFNDLSSFQAELGNWHIALTFAQEALRFADQIKLTEPKFVECFRAKVKSLQKVKGVNKKRVQCLIIKKRIQRNEEAQKMLKKRELLAVVVRVLMRMALPILLSAIVLQQKQLLAVAFCLFCWNVTDHMGCIDLEHIYDTKTTERLLLEWQEWLKENEEMRKSKFASVYRKQTRRYEEIQKRLKKRELIASILRVLMQMSLPTLYLSCATPLQNMQWVTLAACPFCWKLVEYMGCIDLGNINNAKETRNMILESQTDNENLRDYGFYLNRQWSRQLCALPLDGLYFLGIVRHKAMHRQIMCEFETQTKMLQKENEELRRRLAT